MELRRDRGSVLCLVDLEPFGFEHPTQEPHDLWLVVDDKHRWKAVLRARERVGGLVRHCRGDRRTGPTA